VYFWGQVWKIAWLYRKPEKHRGEARQGEFHPWNARATHRETSLRFLGMPELYSEAYITTNCYLWASLQAIMQESVRPMEQRLPSSIRKDQAMPHESSCACATHAWKTPHSIDDYFGWVDGMYAEAAWWVGEVGAGRLLLKQEVHGLWDELLFAWKDMLCLGVGSPLSKEIHVELHHLVGIQDGPSQVYLWKAHSHRMDHSVAGSAVRVWHCLCHSKGDKGKRLANYLAQQPINDYQPMHPEFLDENIMTLLREEVEDKDKDKWIVWFEGTSNALGHGVGAVLLTVRLPASAPDRTSSIKW